MNTSQNSKTGRVPLTGGWDTLPVSGRNRFIVYSASPLEIHFGATPTSTGSFVIPAGTALDWSDQVKDAWIKGPSGVTAFYIT